MARSAAGTLPAKSTCAMTQPPKIVPFALVSAGIGMMRMVEQLAGHASVTHVDEGLRLSMLAVAFLLGNKHKDIVNIGVAGEGLGLSAKHDHCKDEVVLDMIELMGVIN
jgi:hypothetical protein